jgi:hypothetical protein
MNDRKLLAYAIFGVIAAAVFLLLTLKLASDPNVKANLGDSQFRIGRADRVAQIVKERGELLFQDPTGHDRNLVIDHEGDDATKGWHAWLHGTRNEFPTRVEGGYLFVDLRAGAAPSPPTTSPAPTTSPNSTRS